MSTEHSTTTITGGHANVVAGGAAGFMSGADKTKLDAVLDLTSGYNFNWGAVAAAGITAGRFFIRTGAALNSSVSIGEYSCGAVGSRTVTLTWSVQTPLAVDTVTLAVMVNGVASALSANMAAGAVSGQASASITLAAGDRIAVRATQSSTEAGASWNCAVSVQVR